MRAPLILKTLCVLALLAAVGMGFGYWWTQRGFLETPSSLEQTQFEARQHLADALASAGLAAQTGDDEPPGVYRLAELTASAEGWSITGAEGQMEGSPEAWWMALDWADFQMTAARLQSLLQAPEAQMRDWQVVWQGLPLAGIRVDNAFVSVETDAFPVHRGTWLWQAREQGSWQTGELSGDHVQLDWHAEEAAGHWNWGMHARVEQPMRTMYALGLAPEAWGLPSLTLPKGSLFTLPRFEVELSRRWWGAGLQRMVGVWEASDIWVSLPDAEVQLERMVYSWQDVDGESRLLQAGAQLSRLQWAGAEATSGQLTLREKLGAWLGNWQEVQFTFGTWVSGVLAGEVEWAPAREGRPLAGKLFLEATSLTCADVTGLNGQLRVSGSPTRSLWSGQLQGADKTLLTWEGVVTGWLDGPHQLAFDVDLGSARAGKLQVEAQRALPDAFPTAWQGNWRVGGGEPIRGGSCELIWSREARNLSLTWSAEVVDSPGHAWVLIDWNAADDGRLCRYGQTIASGDFVWREIRWQEGALQQRYVEASNIKLGAWHEQTLADHIAWLGSLADASVREDAFTPVSDWQPFDWESLFLPAAP